MKIRRVATGHTENGEAAVVSDVEIEATTVQQFPGFNVYKLWSADHPPQFPDDGSEPSSSSYFPPLGGCRFVQITFPATATEFQAPVDRKALFAEMERTWPGLAGHMERSTPGMHTSDTIDFGYVVSGEIWLELDGGKKIQLRAGDTYVQNGTRHAWRNTGTTPCSIVVALIGVQRSPSGLEVARSSH